MKEQETGVIETSSVEDARLASRCVGAIWGSFVGDALAMPVHWYYNVAALKHDYGEVRDYLAPHNPHPDSYLGKASYHPVNAQAEILHDQAKYWGQPGIHYHQFLKAGENTLNLKLAEELLESLAEQRGYDVQDYLQRYQAFLLTPGRHSDTYVESAHRAFFQNHARGRDVLSAGIENHDIGGLAPLPALVAGLVCLGQDEAKVLAAVRQHVSLTHRGEEMEKAAQDLAGLLIHLLEGAEGKKEVQRLARSRGLDLEKLLSRDDPAVVGGVFGSGCPISGSVPSVLYLARKYYPDFEKALIANTNVGGDNCHRGAVLGGILGAALGRDAIPTRWLSGLVAKNQLTQLIEKICPTPAGA